MFTKRWMGFIIFSKYHYGISSKFPGYGWLGSMVFSQPGIHKNGMLVRVSILYDNYVNIYHHIMYIRQ